MYYQDLKISRELDELLSSMCNEDPLLRLTLFQVLHVRCRKEDLKSIDRDYSFLLIIFFIC